MNRYTGIVLTIVCLLIPTVFADYPELMKAVQLNTGQPNWQLMGHGTNPNSGEQATMDYYVDINSLQNIATPWIVYRSLELYTPYTQSVILGSGKKVGSITSTSLMNCQTITEVPLQFSMMAPDKKTVISQKEFTEALPKTSAPNSPSRQIMTQICQFAYQKQPQPKFDSSILPKPKTNGDAEWVAFAESRKPDKTVTIYYDKKSLVRKNSNLLSYTLRETFNPFTRIVYGDNKVTSRISNKITDCQKRQEATLSTRYYGLGGKLLHTQTNSSYSLQADNPLSIEEAVRHDVCLFIDSLPITNNANKDK